VNGQASSHWRRLAVGGAASLFVGMGLGRFAYSPVIPALAEAGALDTAMAGYVGACNIAGFLFGALAEPWLRARWGERRVLVTCLVVSCLCLAASAAPLSQPWLFAWLAFWRGLVGITVGALMVRSLAVVTRAAPLDKLGQAAGIVFTGVGGGILLAGLVIPALLDYGLMAAWSGVALIGGLATAAGLWGWTAPFPAAGDGPAAPAGPAPPYDGRVIRLMAAQTLFTLGLIPHTIFWIDYIARGLGHGMAFGGFHWALFGLGALTGTYLWGRLADAVGFRAGLVAVFLSLALAAALPVPAPFLWALVFSSLVMGAQPGCSALLSGRTQQLFGARDMPLVWRRMTLAGGIGQGIGGYALVALFDFTGSYLAVFLFGAAAMAAGAAVAATLRD